MCFCEVSVCNTVPMVASYTQLYIVYDACIYAYIQCMHTHIHTCCEKGECIALLPSPMWAEGTVLCCVCVLTPNLFLKSFISKSKQATNLKPGNLRQKVVLYKTGKFLQISVAQIAFNFENKKN